MSAFYLTQPVQIVRDLLGRFPWTIGLCGIVVEIDEGGDAEGFDVRVSSISGIWFHPGELEPIIPLGMESLADTLALWQPEQVAA